MRIDLNDYGYFAEVVAHGGFAAAGRALREPKSKLSRRIAGLEERLGLRLIERSSRRFRVTDTGQAFYERCRAMLAEAEQAEALVVQAQAEPHGRIRFSCPTGMLEPISGLISSFLPRYPKVRLQLVATDRAVDLIEERIDLALRVRGSFTSDAALTMRSLGVSTRILVASPQIASQMASIEQLTAACARHRRRGRTTWNGIWKLTTAASMSSACNPAWAARTWRPSATRRSTVWASRSCRITSAVRRWMRAQLVRVLPAWRGLQGIVHLVFTTRRGLPPAVRALIDHLAAGFPREGV